MSFEHHRWENRVFLYGYAGALASDRIETAGPDKGVLNVGFFLRVTEHLTRTDKQVVSLHWCKARGNMAEAIKLQFTSPRWIRLEGRMRVYNGRSAKRYMEGETRAYIEIEHMWWEDAKARSNSTVVCLKSEYDRLKKIELAWTTGVSKFHIPEETMAKLEYLHADDVAAAAGAGPAAAGAGPAAAGAGDGGLPASEQPSGIQEAKKKRAPARKKPSGS